MVLLAPQRLKEPREGGDVPEVTQRVEDRDVVPGL